jgi:hypothetical protein
MGGYGGCGQYTGGYRTNAAVILVLFILLVIIIGAGFLNFLR